MADGGRRHRSRDGGPKAAAQGCRGRRLARTEPYKHGDTLPQPHISYFFDDHITPFGTPKRGLGAPPARGRTADGGTGPGTAALKPLQGCRGRRLGSDGNL